MDTNQYETRDNVDEVIKKVYRYGSRVYGTATKDSDYDFIIIVESDEDLYYSVNKTNMNLTVYSEPMFIKQIQEHHISALECIFQDKDDPYLKYFELDREKLRRSISATASNSFVKCKKKLKQGDYYIGKKSLFHSLRILGYGIQIALVGEIVDYSAYNSYHDTIMSMRTNEWEDYSKLFKPEFNRKKSEFRRYAPLKSEIENMKTKGVASMEDLESTIVIDELYDDFPDWGVRAINAPKVWDYTKGEGVKVVVIDTGIDMNHKDFTGRIKGTVNAFDKSTTLITDSVGHGTHVAGLIAGSQTGVAPKAELYVSNVLDPRGKGSIASVLDGITYAINVKADILVMSLGMPRELPQIMTTRLKKAYNEGITIVSATGNNSIQQVDYPAKYDYVVGVGGVGKDLNRADFSNYGFDTDIVAPAVDILSTFKDGKYAYMTGTSMSAPLVAGGLALVKAYYRDRGIELSPKDIMNMLHKGARDRYVGHGLFNVAKMIRLEG